MKRFTAISKFEIRNDMEKEVEQAFRERPGLVEEFDGFVALDVIRPRENPAEFWLITHWKDEDSFHRWHRHHRSASHHKIPKGLKLVRGSFELQLFDHITS